MGEEKTRTLETGELEKGFVEPPQEELGTAQRELEPPPELQPEVEKEPDKQLNYAIPYAVGQISWPHDPATAEKYVQTTGPLLDLIEFHKCLGGMEELPTMVRLALGVAVIAGGVVMVKVTQRKRGPSEKGKAAREQTPDERGATGEDQFPSAPEGKASGDGPERHEPTASGADNGSKTRPLYRPYARRGE